MTAEVHSVLPRAGVFQPILSAGLATLGPVRVPNLAADSRAERHARRVAPAEGRSAHVVRGAVERHIHRTHPGVPVPTSPGVYRHSTDQQVLEIPTERNTLA